MLTFSPRLAVFLQLCCNCLRQRSVKLSVPSASPHTRTGGLTMRVTGRGTLLPSIAEDSKACDTKGDGTYGKTLLKLRLASLLCLWLASLWLACTLLSVK
eukprot:scaffold15888_cov48-Phaeocystis_antarctica.AAC.1